MIADKKIASVLSVLAGARLRNAPSKSEAEEVAATWSRAFAGVTAPVLQTAAEDFVLTAEFWPTLAEFRRVVAKVESNHGQSKYADPSRPRAGRIMYIFHPETGEAEEVEVIDEKPQSGVYRVGADGWVDKCIP